METYPESKDYYEDAIRGVKRTWNVRVEWVVASSRDQSTGYMNWGASNSRVKSPSASACRSGTLSRDIEVNRLFVSIIPFMIRIVFLLLSLLQLAKSDNQVSQVVILQSSGVQCDGESVHGH